MNAPVGRLPLAAGLSDRDRIRPAQAAILEVKEHPLRQVDLDQVGTFDGHDVAIVDVNRVAGMQPIRDLLPVLAGQNFGTLAESRTDVGKGAAFPGEEIEFAACDPMRNRRERRGGSFGGRAQGRTLLCVR